MKNIDEGLRERFKSCRLSHLANLCVTCRDCQFWEVTNIVGNRNPNSDTGQVWVRGRRDVPLHLKHTDTLVMGQYFSLSGLCKSKWLNSKMSGYYICFYWPPLVKVLTLLQCTGVCDITGCGFRCKPVFWVLTGFSTTRGQWNTDFQPVRVISNL